jgi:hypothetical protein
MVCARPDDVQTTTRSSRTAKLVYTTESNTRQGYRPRLLARPSFRTPHADDRAAVQRFFEGFEALPTLRRGHTHLADVVPGYEAAHATVHERVRTVAQAVTACGTRLSNAVVPVA